MKRIPWRWLWLSWMFMILALAIFDGFHGHADRSVWMGLAVAGAAFGELSDIRADLLRVENARLQSSLRTAFSMLMDRRKS